MSERLVEALNAPTREERLAALRELMELYRSGALEKPVPTDYVNNHIHTIYSFSPYSPVKAAYMAWMSGLTTAGIMDHDSVSGAEEFIEAGKIIGIATTVGMECRCSVAGTPFAGRRINNPDQKSVAYLALHGIPHQSLARVRAFIAPYQECRNQRNRAMTENLNRLLVPCGINLDFERDIAPLSQFKEGGSITERHILYALAGAMMEKIGRGRVLLDFLGEKLSIPVSGSLKDRLLETENSMYRYYLLGLLKGQLVDKFYIPATDECPHIFDFLALAWETGAISAYPYLGDVAGSVTGDKKDQTFEDAFLDELVAWLAAEGFNAITYMPTRNTSAQLERLMALCERHGLFQISGEDINSPFQSFICPSLEKPRFRHLVTATWALIGHEKAATNNLADGMFSPEAIAELPGLPERIERFAAIGRQ